MAFCVGVVAQSRPCQIDRVQRNHRALQQSGSREFLLDLRQNRHNADHNAQHQVDGDEEFVQRAIVVNVQKYCADDGERVL